MQQQSRPASAALLSQRQPPVAGPSGLVVLDSVGDYEKLHRIGEGTYGVVYKARDRRTGEIVALKKVRFDRVRDGVPVTSIREMRALQQCRHPNIVRLLKVVTGSKSDSIFLVFEFADYDLGRVLDKKVAPFSLPEVKCLVQQLLEAVACLHQHWVLHRDIKMSNLLYCRTGELKLCDLGLARYFEHVDCAMTPRVVTLWYRSPELLLGAEVYGAGVDMWAVGCVLGELLQHAPLFPGASELAVLTMQAQLLGSPTPTSWPGMAALPHASMFRMPSPHEGSRLHTVTARCVSSHHHHHHHHQRERPRSASPSAASRRHSHGRWGGDEGGRRSDGPHSCHTRRRSSRSRSRSPPPSSSSTRPSTALDLLSQLLAWDPSRRPSARQALAHPWFTGFGEAFGSGAGIGRRPSIVLRRV